MPVIRITMGKKDNVEMKKMLIEKLTSVAVEVTKAPTSVFTVFIEEVEHENMGIGGQPVIKVTMGKANVEMKKMLIEKLTSAAVEVTKAPASVFTVLIEELDNDNMGVGGQTLAEMHHNK